MEMWIECDISVQFNISNHCYVKEVKAFWRQAWYQKLDNNDILL